VSTAFPIPPVGELQDFMMSRVRVKIVELFFANPKEMYYVREISRGTKEEINAVRRELDRMLMNGILRSEERGNRLYYYLNKTYVLYPELLRMVAKTTGLGAELIKYRKKLGSPKFVMFSGRFASKEASRQGEVDVLVVGEIVLAELELIMKQAEATLQHEINYTVLGLDEFVFRKQRRDPFILDVLYGTRVMILGDEEELIERKPQGV
jgi:hypothetical protein